MLGEAFKIGGQFYPAIIGQFCTAIDTASKKIGSKLRRFYLRMRARRGANVAIVALARKILCILYHLLMNQEIYEESGVAKRTRPNRLDQLPPQRGYTAQEMVDILKRSGYEVRKIDRGACS